MRYEIEAYKLIGVEHFRIIDTFNGRKVVAKGFQTDAQAITRRDELNQFNIAKSRNDHSVAYATQMPAAESIKTPREARDFAVLVSRVCFNDEIRAHVARELLKHILMPADAIVARDLDRALLGASSLVSAFDRQYQD